jgi:large subunit ribosomal protein L31
MREGIHPEYKDCVVTCSCGNVMHLRSTKASSKVNVCSLCHPFYTGQQQRILDTEGRVESFKNRYQLYIARMEQAKK